MEWGLNGNRRWYGDSYCGHVHGIARREIKRGREDELTIVAGSILILEVEISFQPRCRIEGHCSYLYCRIHLPSTPLNFEIYSVVLLKITLLNWMAPVWSCFCDPSPPFAVSAPVWFTVMAPFFDVALYPHCVYLHYFSSPPLLSCPKPLPHSLSSCALYPLLSSLSPSTPLAWISGVTLMAEELLERCFPATGSEPPWWPAKTQASSC